MRRTVLVATIALCAAAASAAPLPTEARLLWGYPSPGVAPVDLNGDSVDELLLYDSDVYVIARDQQLGVRSASRRFTEDTRRAGRPFPVDETLAWVPRVRRDSLFLMPVWTDRTIFVSAVPHPLPGDFWDGGINALAVRDLDCDGAEELLVTIQAGFSRWPRGVACIDPRTGQRLWFFPTGPNPASLELRDVNGDGRLEVIFGSTAPGNGNRAAGTDDAHTYVFCLSSDGSLLWRREVGSYGQTASVAWFAGELLVDEQGNPIEEAEPDSIFLLDPRSGAINDYAQIGRCGKGVVALRDSLVVSAASDDTLRIFDAALKLVRTRTLNASGATRICVGRFTVPERLDLAVATTKGTVHIYDASARLLAELGPIPMTNMLPLSNRNRDRLLVEAAQGKEASWQLYEFDPLPLLRRRVTLWTALAGLGLVAAVFLATLAVIRYRQTSDLRAVVRGLTGQAGVVELDGRGRLRRANAKGRELLTAAGANSDKPLSGRLAPLSGASPDGTPRDLPLSLPTGQTILARAAPVKSGTLLTLEDISAVEYMKRVTSWAPVAQKLAHDIKNPLTAMALTLQRLEKHRSPETDRYYMSMKDEIDRLKKMTDGFMRLSKLEPPKLVPGSVNDLVRSCLAKFEDVKPPGISVVSELADNLPLIALDAQQLSVACSNIVENAISAIVGSGAVTVRTSLIVGEKKVAVCFSDTGKGIPERYLSKVFEPYFTLKPGGTGLGMALTKRIIEDHKGTISIQSKEGEGTTVTIELPTA